MLRSQLTGFTPFGNFSMDSKLTAKNGKFNRKFFFHLTPDPLKIQFITFVYEKKNNYERH